MDVVDTALEGSTKNFQNLSKNAKQETPKYVLGRILPRHSS